MIKIESKEEYERYTLEMYDLMDVLCDPERKSETAELEKHLDDLVDAIEEYENIHYPINPPSEESLKEFREDQERENL